jgi:hypothetical protein
MVHEKGTELGWLVQSADNRLKHFWRSWTSGHRSKNAISAGHLKVRGQNRSEYVEL